MLCTFTFVVIIIITIKPVKTASEVA